MTDVIFFRSFSSFLCSLQLIVPLRHKLTSSSSTQGKCEKCSRCKTAVSDLPDLFTSSPFQQTCPYIAKDIARVLGVGRKKEGPKGGITTTGGLVKYVDNALLRNGVSTVLCTESLGIICKILSISATSFVVPAHFFPWIRQNPAFRNLTGLTAGCRSLILISPSVVWLWQQNNTGSSYEIFWISKRVTRCYCLLQSGNAFWTKWLRRSDSSTIVESMRFFTLDSMC